MILRVYVNLPDSILYYIRTQCTRSNARALDCDPLTKTPLASSQRFGKLSCFPISLQDPCKADAILEIGSSLGEPLTGLIGIGDGRCTDS